MKKTALSIGIAAAFMMGGSSVMAGSIPNSDIIEFKGGDTAKADDVNDNFRAVKDAVNDNDARITANKLSIGDANSGLVKGVADNKAAIGDANSGLVKDVAANKAAIGDENSGLVKDVVANKAAIGDASSGLVKDVADNKAAIEGKAAASGSGNTIDGNASDIGSLQTGVNDLKAVVGDSNSGLVKDVADLQAGGGCPSDAGVMVQVGPICVDKYEASARSAAGVLFGVGGVDDYTCDDNGSDCKGVIFASSEEGASSSKFITWNQAQQACANSGKRLLTNAEWMMASATGWGVSNMADGVYEWTADWLSNTQGLLRSDGSGNGNIDEYTPWLLANANEFIGFRCAK